MSLDLIRTFLPIFLVFLGFIISMGTYIIRRMIHKIDRLEENYVSRQEVRLMIDEKVRPIHHRINAVDHKLDQIIHLLLESKK